MKNRIQIRTSKPWRIVLLLIVVLGIFGIILFLQSKAPVNDSETVRNDYREWELKQAMEHGMNLKCNNL